MAQSSGRTIFVLYLSQNQIMILGKSIYFMYTQIMLIELFVFSIIFSNVDLGFRITCKFNWFLALDCLPS